MQIPNKKIERILELYKPECRFLIKAPLEASKANGRFRIIENFYATQLVEHMTSIEAQFCLNQLCYAASSEWLADGRFGVTIGFERFLELMKENMFVIDSNIRFKKPIPTNNDIQGQVELMKVRKYGNLYLAFLDYELEQGKSKGNLELALKI